MRKKSGCYPCDTTAVPPPSATSVNRSQSALSSLVSSISTLNLSSVNATVLNATTAAFSALSSYTVNAVEVGGFTLKGPLSGNYQVATNLFLEACPIGTNVAVGATFTDLVTTGMHAWQGPQFTSTYDNETGILSVAGLKVGTMQFTSDTGTWTQPNPLHLAVPALRLPSILFQRWYSYKDVLEDSGIWTSGVYRPSSPPLFGWMRDPSTDPNWLIVDITDDVRAEADKGSVLDAIALSFSVDVAPMVAITAFYVVTHLVDQSETVYPVSWDTPVLGVGYHYDRGQVDGVKPGHDSHVSLRIEVRANALSEFTLFGCTVTWQRRGW